MSPNAEKDQDSHPEEGDLHLEQPLDSIEGNLMAEMPTDDRFESGVPEGQRANSLDFIQMTGLTRAPLRNASAESISETEVNDDDLNPTAPLSFYEKGVTDVDDGDGGDRDGLSDMALDASLIPERGSDTLRSVRASSSIDAFRDIVAGLEAGTEKFEPPVPSYPEPELNDVVEAVPESFGEERSASSDLLAMLDALDAAAKHADSTDGLPEAQAYDMPEQLDDEDLPALAAPIDEPAPVDSEAMVDDWDTLFESVTPGESSVSPVAPAPARAPSASGALAEAEQLMQSLGRVSNDKGPSETPKPTPVPVPSLLPTYSNTVATVAELDGELAYDYSAAPTRRRSKRHSRAVRRGRRALKIIVALVVILGGLGTLMMKIVLPAWEKAEGLESKASRFMNEGKYVEASDAYKALSRKLVGDPTGQADAQFKAAYVLTLGEPRTGNERDKRYRSALEQFQAFVDSNPQHPKRTRALTIMGRLYYELHDYDEAIDLLRDQVEPRQDPQAALTMLRYLARSYNMKSDYEAAESAYLRAVGVEGSYGVDQDYSSLGEMFKARADLAVNSEADKELFIEKAKNYWQLAMQVPGIDPARKVALRESLNWLDSAGQVPADPAATEGITDLAVETLPMETPDVVAEPTLPEPENLPTEGTQEENPNAELNAVLDVSNASMLSGETAQDSSAPPVENE